MAFWRLMLALFFFALVPYCVAHTIIEENDPQTNMFGPQEWCDACFKGMKYLGMSFVLLGSQTLSATEIFAEYCKRLVISEAEACRDRVFFVGSSIGYSEKTLGNVMDEFCRLNPLCSYESLAGQATLNVTPLKVLQRFACSHCQDLVMSLDDEPDVFTKVAQFCKMAMPSEESLCALRLEEHLMRDDSLPSATAEALCIHANLCPSRRDDMPE